MATLLSFVRSQPLGWSNDEKAQFARIQKLLGDAGVMVEVEHGLTDEDEPWCVFCSGGGDVIVHAARIDGHYIFDSAALPSTIRGRSLDDCARRFIDDATVLARQPQQGSKILLHPSALLAGVMLTIFLYLETVGESSAHGRVILELDDELQDDAENRNETLPTEVDDDAPEESPLLVLKQMLHQITEATQKQESDRTGGGHGNFASQPWGSVMLPAVVAAIAYAQDSMAGPVIDDGTPSATVETEGETGSEIALSDVAKDVQFDPDTMGDAASVVEGDDAVRTEGDLAQAFLVTGTSAAPFEGQGGYGEPTALPDATLEDIELSERSVALVDDDTEVGQEAPQGSPQEEPIALSQVSQDVSAASNLVRFISDSSIELQDEIFALSDFVEAIGAEEPGPGLDILEDLTVAPSTPPPSVQDDTLVFLPVEPVMETVSTRDLADQITQFVRVTGLLRYDIADRSHLTIYDESVIGLEESADVTFRSFALHDDSTVTFIGFDHELDMVFA